MRRNSENLLVLAGEEPVRKWSEPVPLGGRGPGRLGRDRAVRPGGAHRPAGDHGLRAGGGRRRAPAGRAHRERHRCSPPGIPRSRCRWADAPGGGVLIEVRDEGVGVSAARLAEMNWRLDHPPGVDVSVSRHMGLFAVSRLAARHGIRVRLRAGTPQGLTALVWLPGTPDQPRAAADGRHALAPAPRGQHVQRDHVVRRRPDARARGGAAGRQARRGCGSARPADRAAGGTGSACSPPAATSPSSRCATARRPAEVGTGSRAKTPPAGPSRVERPRQPRAASGSPPGPRPAAGYAGRR